MAYKKSKIISNKELTDRIYKMRVEGDFKGEAGQFYMLRGWSGLDPFLSRPISIYDLGAGYIEFLYEDRGVGTNLLSSLKAGDSLALLGPLGTSFGKLEGRIALVGGGIGIAPLLYLAKELGVKPDIYCGFRDQVYELDRMEDLGESVYISTDSGAFGHKGFITDLIDYDRYDRIVSCGPAAMMRIIVGHKKDTIVSMEEKMACGIGACMGCNIETKSGNKKVCKDGPVFLGEEVFF